MRQKLLIVGRGNEIGGGTEYIITLIKMLRERFDIEIHMTYGKEEIKQNYLKHFDYVTFHQVPMAREINPAADFKSIRRLYRLMKQEKFDIVHTNTSKGGIVGRIAAKLAGTPFIFHTVHGFAFHEQSSRSAILVYSFIEKLAAKCCDYIVTVSDFHKDWAVRLNIAPEEKIISIPNGLDPERVKPTAERGQIREALKIDQDEIAIFTIGRLARQKGIEYLIQAAALLESEPVERKYRFYIAGSGELEHELKEQVHELNLSHKVTFLGYRSDVNDLLFAADIVVLPSLWEGLSIALLEAMSAKKAIVCTDIGSTVTVVEQHKQALIVKSKDPVGLKESIQYLIEHDDFRHMLSEAAYARFSNHFTKAMMLSRYHLFYKNIAGLKENRRFYELSS